MSSLNVVVFGKAGVGKSSVINMMAGKPIAQISADVEGCTRAAKDYTFKLQVQAYDQHVHIWDTVGLQEPKAGAKAYHTAIQEAFRLVHDISCHGGIDLLILCHNSKERINATALSNYKLFNEVLCKKKVPLALVVTHLESEGRMDDWWSRNEGEMKKFGIVPAAHACVTGLEDHNKRGESLVNISQMFAGHNGERFILPSEGGSNGQRGGFLGWFTGKSGKNKEKQQEIAKGLREHLKMDPKVALELAGKLEKYVFD